MAKQIKEFTAHDITGNDDALLFQTSGGTTYKVLWSQIISKIINDHITNGSNVTLTRTGNVLTISATGGGSTYSPGDGIDITNNAISVKLGTGLSLNATTGNIDVTGGGGGAAYTAGDGISISADDVISLDLSDVSSTSARNLFDTYMFQDTSGNIKKIMYGALLYYIITDGIIQGDNINIALSQGSQSAAPHVTISALVPDWKFADTAPTTHNDGDYWVHTEAANKGQIDKYDITSDQWVTQGNFAGKDGASATVTVGTVTTGNAGTDAAVTNSGTSSAAVFDFVIPRGADGTNGYSVSFTSAPITGGHSVTISSTDPNVNDETFNVMDGTEVIQATSDNRTVTLLAADWVGESAPYTQTVSVLGMTSSVVPIIGLVPSATVETGIEEQKQWSYITKAVSGTDSITFYCYKTKPTIDLTANVKAV